ncbi:MAG: 2-oxoacid:acceptor oxidoreductase family protein [Candidatus Helarchaeota archaeon]
MTRIELKIAGYGGQGVITLSKLIAEGTMLFENKEVAQTEAYGAAARGGSCWAEVVISDNEIDYPRAVDPDYMILLSKEAANAFKKGIKKNGVFIVDPTTVKKFRARKNTVYEIPATDIAVHELKMPVVGNVILLGAISVLTGLMSKEAAKKTVEKSVPKKALDVNLVALQKGFELAEKALKDAEKKAA